MHRKHGSLILYGVTLAALMSVTSASWAAGYVGASYGRSDIDESITDGLITSGTVDGEDSGFKLFGGAQLNPNVAFELAYIDAGKVAYSGEFFGEPVTDGTVEVTGFNFSVVGNLPISRQLSLLGRIGFLSWEAEASDITGGVPFSETDDGTDPSFGFGAQYNFTRQAGLRLEWERLDVEVDVDFLSLGIVANF